MKSFRFLIMFWVLFIAKAYIYGQAVDMNAPIDIDPNVKIGKLANGLTYYIRNNHKPENRVVMRLAVKSGSCNEDDNQQGLAHFNEHMSFDGTEHFQKKEVIDYLESIGMKFGADLNAYTSFDETVYKLQVPADKSDMIDKGFLILEDWAHNLTFDDKEIDKERNVVMEEWRLGLGADDRMMKKFMPVLLKGSRYADRLPIGKPEVLKNCKHEVLKAYHRDWYRPDLMAVVIVGEIDVNTAEKKIKEHFEKLTNPENERKLVEWDIPENKEPLVSVCTDKEATNSMIQIYFKHPRLKQVQIKDYRKWVLFNLFTAMLNQRLDEIRQKPESPFAYAGSFYSQFLAKSKDAYALYAVAKENQIEKTIETLITENERVKKFSFAQSEFDRAKDDMLSRYETMAKEADKTESESFVGEYLRNFLSNEPIPGIKNELKYVEDILPTLKLKAIDKLVDEMISDNNEAIVVTAPEKADLKVPSEKEVLNAIQTGKSKEITMYEDKVAAGPLFDEKTENGKIVSSKEDKAFGFTELTFSNGIKAVLKPTDFKNDEILFSGYSTGGTSVTPDKELCSAIYAPAVMSECGVSRFSKIELGKKLSGKIVSIEPYIDECKQGFRGSSTPKDFETLLQLTNLYFNKPRKDNEAYQAFLSNIKNQIKSMMAEPQVFYFDTMSRIATMNDPRTISLQLPRMKDVEKINLDDAYHIYKERFSDASGFTFFFTGNFKIDEIKPMLEKYLGSLPATNKKETWQNHEPKFPTGIKDVTVYKGKAPKSFVTLMMKEKFDWSYKNIWINRVMMGILDIRLREKMRDQESGVYAWSASGEEQLYPEPLYQPFIYWGCAPDNTDKLTKAALDEIKELQKNGPSKTDLNKIKETMNRDRETNMKKNDFWLAILDEHYYLNKPLTNLEEYQKMINSITSDEVQKAAQRYLPLDHYTRVVLKPEK